MAVINTIMNNINIAISPNLAADVIPSYAALTLNLKATERTDLLHIQYHT